MRFRMRAELLQGAADVEPPVVHRTSVRIMARPTSVRALVMRAGVYFACRSEFESPISTIEIVRKVRHSRLFERKFRLAVMRRGGIER
jgi:hypothetical protein